MAGRASQSCSPVVSPWYEKGTVRGGHRRTVLHFAVVAEWFPLTNQGHWSLVFLQLSFSCCPCQMLSFHTVAAESHRGQLSFAQRCRLL